MPVTAPEGEVGAPGGNAPSSAAVMEASSLTIWRRINSVISSDPIHTRRTWSMLTTSASARSCAGVHSEGDHGTDFFLPACREEVVGDSPPVGDDAVICGSSG